MLEDTPRWKLYLWIATMPFLVVLYVLSEEGVDWAFPFLVLGLMVYGVVWFIGKMLE